MDKYAGKIDKVCRCIYSITREQKCFCFATMSWVELKVLLRVPSKPAFVSQVFFHSFVIMFFKSYYNEPPW
jgi:hypothetical protein